MRHGVRIPYVRRVRPGSGPAHNADVSFDLDRFVQAQDHAYQGALRELRAGRKTGHWIWYVFPQLAGLGHSEPSRYYAITSLGEATAYLAHPILGPRLRECATTVAASTARSADDVFGWLDAKKVRSSMTLFHRAAPDQPEFLAVLDRYYHATPDPETDRLLG